MNSDLAVGAATGVETHTELSRAVFPQINAAQRVINILQAAEVRMHLERLPESHPAVVASQGKSALDVTLSGIRHLRDDRVEVAKIMLGCADAIVSPLASQEPFIVQPGETLDAEKTLMKSATLVAGLVRDMLVVTESGGTLNKDQVQPVFNRLEEACTAALEASVLL